REDDAVHRVPLARRNDPRGDGRARRSLGRRCTKTTREVPARGGGQGPPPARRRGGRTMNHVSTLDLHRLRYGELDKARASEVRTHVDGCPTCTERLQAQHAMRAE